MAKTKTIKAQNPKLQNFMEKNDVGEALIVQIRSFVEKFVSFPEQGQSTVAALWVIGAWLTDAMHVWPYLVITADTRGAGKTTLLRALAMLVPTPIPATSGTLSYLIAKLQSTGVPAGDPDPATGYQQTTPLGTMVADESESIPAATQKFLRIGYKRGEVHGKRTPTGIDEVQCYGPKLFALIGTLEPTLYSRTILIRLRRVAAPPMDLIEWLAEPEAETIRQQLAHLRDQMLRRRATGERIDIWAPDARMVARSRELWGSMFGVAKFLKLSEATQRVIVEQADRIETAKDSQGENRQRISADKERQALADMRAFRVLRDSAELVADLPTISSAGLLDRLRGVTLGGWGTLTPEELANLLARYGLRPGTLRAADRPKERQVEQVPTAKDADGNPVKWREKVTNRHPLARGYDAAAIRAAWQQAESTGQGAYLEAQAEKGDAPAE